MSSSTEKIDGRKSRNRPLGQWQFPERRYYKSWRLWENHLRERIRKDGLPPDPDFARAMLLQANLHRFLLQNRLDPLQTVANRLGVSDERTRQLYQEHEIFRPSHSTNAAVDRKLGKREEREKFIWGDHLQLIQLVHKWQQRRTEEHTLGEHELINSFIVGLTEILTAVDPNEKPDGPKPWPRWNEKGERLCSICKKYKPVERFTKSTKLSTGLQYKCRDCNVIECKLKRKTDRPYKRKITEDFAPSMESI